MKEKNREPLFHIVKRDALPWYKSLGIRFVAILLALILCGIITTITTGINPLQVYQRIGDWISGIISNKLYQFLFNSPGLAFHIHGMDQEFITIGR